MDCIENFRAFHENISLKKTREERINDAFSALRDFVSNDKGQEPKAIGVADVLIETFVQGSYAMGTSIRPVNEQEEFDVDVVLSLNLADGGNLPNPTETLEWLAERLKENKNYARKTEVRRRCVRVNYAGEFHLDIVPVVPVPGHEPIVFLPDRTGDWTKTNPKGLMAWCDERERESGRRLRRMVKYLKWWRSAVAPKRVEVTSVVLTTLLGHHASRGTSDAEALVGTMESLAEWVGQCLKKPVIPNPSLLEGDLAEKWTQRQFEEFRSCFQKTSEIGRKALDEPDPQKSVALWRRIFGDQFPTLDDDQGGYVHPRSPGRRATREFA